MSALRNSAHEGCTRAGARQPCGGREYSSATHHVTRVANLNASAALAASGALSENVNNAIKSSFLLNFLESVPGVEAKLMKPNTVDEKSEDVVKQAQKAAALALVY